MCENCNPTKPEPTFEPVAEAPKPVAEVKPELTTYQRLIAFVQNTPDAPCRRWSYEIEAVGLGAVSAELQRLGMFTHNDPSITDSNSCECECSECSHSCDCDRCDIYNGWDNEQHCGECNDTECAPSDDQPVTTTHDLERLPLAIAALNSAGAYTDETCGGHIHVDASDLNARQVASVMKLWRKFAELMPEVIMRENNRYAEPNTDSDLEGIIEGNYAPERYREVNALNWFNAKNSTREHPNKYTLEFRAFQGEINAELITARGFICRAIIEHAKSNRANIWLLSATDSAKFLRELGISL